MKKYFNLTPSSQKGLLHVLKWKLLTRPKPWPKEVANTHKHELPASVAPEEVCATFINHSTVLLQLHNLTVITDPIFSDVAGPLSFFGPKRVRAPGVPFV